MTSPQISPKPPAQPESIRERVFRIGGVRETLASVEVLALRRAWSAGFGTTLDPFHANLTGASEAKCRRDLAKLMMMYADRLSFGPEARCEFIDAVERLKSAPSNEPWSCRVVADHHDLTFWLMRDVDAIRSGVRPKR